MILSNEFYLSHQADLPVRILERNARRMVMIGQAFAGEDGDGRDDLSHELSGRFTWIDWPYLYTDASALLPVYYTGHLDEPLITSSVALAAKLADAAVSRRSIRWGGLNWTPPPGSSVSNLGKLLRDQRLYIPSAAVEFVDRSIRPAASFDQAKQRLASDLTTISRSVGKRSGNALSCAHRRARLAHPPVVSSRRGCEIRVRDPEISGRQPKRCRGRRPDQPLSRRTASRHRPEPSERGFRPSLARAHPRNPQRRRRHAPHPPGPVQVLEGGRHPGARRVLRTRAPILCFPA